jgi:hypothetical protein
MHGAKVFKSSVRICLLCFICVLYGVMTGCMIIPTPEHTLLEGRGKIEESDMFFLESTKTTREDVLLRFGEPDLILNQDRILIYHWTVSHGYWFVGGGYSSAGGPIPKDYLIMLEFDEQGLLKKHERTGSILTSTQARIDKWTPHGIEKVSDMNREIFMIDPTPRPYLPDTPASPVSFRMGEFHHLVDSSHGDNLIGHKIAAFGVIIADVRTCRPAIETVRSAVIAQLENAGYRLVDHDEDIIITGDLEEFGVNTTISLSSWSAVGSLDITLKFCFSSSPQDLLIRRYQSSHVSKTILGPSKDDFEQVMRGCLEDMQQQMATDPELIKLPQAIAP